MTENTQANRPVHPAALLAVLLLAAVASPISLNKVSPIAPALMQALGIGESQIGMLISAVPLTGIALALPGGLLVRRFGPWACMLAALGSLALGSLAGSFSASFAALAASRIVEGAGMALTAVAGPAAVGEAAGARNRGLAMGLFAATMGVGQVAIFNIAPPLLQAFGWQGAWHFATLYAAVLFAACLVTALRAGALRRPQVAAPRAKAAPARPVLKSGRLWGLAAAMGLYVASYMSIQMFLPSYLSTRLGMTLSAASAVTSACCFAGTVSSLAAGRLSDRLGSRRVLGGLCLIAGAALFVPIPFAPASLFLPLAIILGVVPPVLPVCVLAAASDIFPEPEQGGVAMGVIMLAQNAGLTLGPVLFGAVAEGLGWNMAFFAMVPLAVIGGLTMLWNRGIK